jgi:hypothetical protein
MELSGKWLIFCSSLSELTFPNITNNNQASSFYEPEAVLKRFINITSLNIHKIPVGW